jgi:hypothetical protein
VALIASLVLLTLGLMPLPASAWNIPGHILSGIIAYHVLQQENPATIDRVKAMLEKHPWYAHQWQARLHDIPASDRRNGTIVPNSCVMLLWRLLGVSQISNNEPCYSCESFNCSCEAIDPLKPFKED